MIGESDQLHAATFQYLVGLFGGRVTLATPAAQERRLTHPGVARVNVQVALHAIELGRTTLQPDDILAKS